MVVLKQSRKSVEATVELMIMNVWCNKHRAQVKLWSHLSSLERVVCASCALWPSILFHLTILRRYCRVWPYVQFFTNIWSDDPSCSECLIYVIRGGVDYLKWSAKFLTMLFVLVCIWLWFSLFSLSHYWRFDWLVQIIYQPCLRCEHGC